MHLYVNVHRVRDEHGHFKGISFIPTELSALLLRIFPTHSLKVESLFQEKIKNKKIRRLSSCSLKLQILSVHIMKIPVGLSRFTAQTVKKMIVLLFLSHSLRSSMRSDGGTFKVRQ